jgi:formylglycine-generating enzyme required for sulfatase activity
MPWPLSQDYNEAIQNPASSFADPELREGYPVANALGMPMPRSGNFADVYEFRGRSGSKWALKCFTREVAGLQHRYSEISKHLLQAKLPFTVDFKYLAQGVRIRGQWYPVLKMHWVEGFLLNEFVRDNLDKPSHLEGLSQIWLRMSRRLREARIAHADLQHGNVILVPGSRAASLAVKLIDYDGTWVPALISKRSGEVGHPAYQHPQRLRQGIYSPEVDRLPLLAVACALRALAVGGKALWDRHDNGDNLLFREADLRHPAGSALFRELWGLPDPFVHDLVGYLTIGLTGLLHQVPLLHEISFDDGTRPLSPAEEQQATAVLGQGKRVARLAARPAVPPPVAVRAGRPPSVAMAPGWQFTSLEGPAGAGRKRRKAGRSLVKRLALAACLLALLGAGGAGYLLTRQTDAEDSGPAQTRQESAGKGKPRKPRQIIARKTPPKNPVAPKLPTDRKPPARDGGAKPPADQPVRSKPQPSKPVPDRGKPKAGDVLHNAIGMKLAYIPAGKFLMGSSKEQMEQLKKGQHWSEKGWEKAEVPQHQVTISRPFYLGAYEVTQGQYEKVMGTNPSYFSPQGPGKDRVKGLDTREFPVEGVSWQDAMAFCKKLSELPEEKKAGRRYRLPKEAEWEYACRAGTRTLFHHGDSISFREANFNAGHPYGNAPRGPPISRPVKVGSYRPNAWGLYDMHGNVWEWCLDGPRQYTADAVKDPRGPDPEKSVGVLRGGSWVVDGWSCRCTYHKVRPVSDRQGERVSYYRTPHSGFRVLCEP